MATVISIVSYPFLPARVGGQKGVALFNKYFCRYLKLVCVTTRKNDPASAEGYEVLPILSNSPLRYINPFYLLTIRSLVRKNSATHIMLEHPYYGWLGVLLKWICGVKLIVHSHNIEGLRWKMLNKWWWKILWGYEKFTHRQADFNFFIHDEDREYAIREFALKSGLCITMTYGIEWDQAPDKTEMDSASRALRQKHRIRPEEKILLFNGAFNYTPNLEALRQILSAINPLLAKKEGFYYKILLCGRDIPAEVSSHDYPNVIFAGFVEDVSLYFRGSDVFLNPVTQGGGIKTKLVEALGSNLNAVSTIHGALGVDPALCGGKLLLCQDQDWETFAGLVVQATRIQQEIPPSYFNYFYWGYSTRRAAEFIQGTR